MRKLLLIATLLLSVSGLFIAFAHLPDPQAGVQKITVLAHIWIGVAYLVIFPLYAWDHISKNRRWLKAARALTVSGLLQLTCGIVVLLTGMVLLAYGGAFLLGLRSVHHWVTYPLLAALAWHYLSPKRWIARVNTNVTEGTSGK
jgi:hypothetical protein